ncbi:MAG: tetratricopeptide repeat protein [Vulcanimicrobiota bacterium]
MTKQADSHADTEAREASFYCDELLKIYQALKLLSQRVTPGDEQNPCGCCNQCCAAPVRLHLSALELELLRSREPDFREDEFLCFVNRPHGKPDAPDLIVCPHYDEERRGCIVYNHRPMCCRVFGYVPGRTMREGCVFGKGQRDALKWRDIDKVLNYFTELRHSYYRQFRRSIKVCTPMDHILTGTVLIEEGMVELGFREYDMALLRDPENALVHCCQARKKEMRGDLLGAEESYRKAQQYDPEDSTLTVMLGFVLYGQNRFREALDLYDKALQQNPYLFMAWGNKGLAHLAVGEREKALEAYTKGLEAEPTYGTFHVMQGTILESLGDFRSAEEAYCRAIVCCDSDPLPHLCLGKLLRKRRRFGDAFRAFFTFRELSGEGSQAHSVDRELYELSLIRKGSVNHLIALAQSVHQPCLFIFLFGMDLPL